MVVLPLCRLQACRHYIDGRAIDSLQLPMSLADVVSADDTDLILQSDQSVACVNSRLAWSFEWAWMIYAVSVGYRRNTYNTTVQVHAQVHCAGRITYCIRYS